MSENTLKARFQHASKTEAEWKSSNPVLLKGEIAYSSDKHQWKTGDGATKWTDLPYDKADPTTHNHDDRYYTETEMNAKLNAKADTNKGALFVVGTHTSTTNAWTGKLSGVSALFDGLLIDYWVPFNGTGSGNTLNLTLDDGTTTGEKNMYYKNTSRLTTHYNTGSVIRLVYRIDAVINNTKYTGWWNVSSYDSNDTTNISFGNGRIYAGTNGIWRYTLAALDNENKWQSFVTSSSTGTTKTINTSAKFRLPAQIVYYGASNDAKNNALVGSTYNTWQIREAVDLRWSTNCTTTQFTASKPIYLECILTSDGYFQITSNCITQTLVQGKYYVYLGNMYDAYRLGLTSQHPMYYYDGTNLVDYVSSLLANKSNVGHTHNYAGSSSAGGVANSAAKLSTSRNISANDDYVMNFNFDGSSNVSTSLRAYNATISVGNQNNFPLHRFAKTDVITQNYRDYVTTFLITQDYNGGGYGICRIVLRTNNQSKNKDLSTLSIEWLVRSGFAVDSIQAGLYTKDGQTYADVFFKSGGTYAGTVIRNLGSGSRGNIGRTWTLVNSIEKDNTTTSDKLASTEVYATIAAAGTELHKQEYTSTVTGKDVGNTNYSNTAGSAGSATKATQDSRSQQIDTTYVKELSAKNGIITYAKGNDAIGTINTQDNFITLTQEEYDELVSSGKIDENYYYFVTDANSSPSLIQYITLTASGWIASSDGTYYTQQVTAAQITADDNPMVIKNMPYSTGATEAKKYLKAFSILCSGVAETAAGSVTWKVFKKPVTDISVGLIKVLE